MYTVRLGSQTLPLSQQFIAALTEAGPDWTDQASGRLQSYAVGDVGGKLARVLTAHRADVQRALDTLIALLDGERPAKRLIFIVGAPRTGGTYLTQAICRYHGVDTEQHAAVLHDGFPALGTLADLPLPKRRLHMAWQWAQWLALVGDVAVKKLHTLVYDMEMADFLGAEVIGTTRDPDDALASLLRRGESDITIQVTAALRRIGRPTGDLSAMWPHYWTDFYGRLKADRMQDFGPDMAAPWGGTGFVSRPQGHV